MPYTILLLEDDDAQRDATQAQLQSLGYVVIPVANGMMALRAAETQTIHLLLADVYLPGGPHGPSVANILHYRHNIPAIFMTAYREMADRSRYPLPGKLLHKPADFADIVAEIEQALAPAPSQAPHASTDRIRRWRLKAEELRTTAESYLGTTARESMLYTAKAYEILADADEARLENRVDQKPEAG